MINNILVKLVGLLLIFNSLLAIPDTHLEEQLFKAISEKDITQASQLIDKKVNVNQVYGDLALTPLHMAVLNKLEPLVIKLLNAGADPNARDASGETPIFKALLTANQVPILLELASHGAQLNLENKAGYTPLHITAYNGLNSYAQELIRLGANVNIKGQNGDTALHLAVYDDNLPLVKMLLAAGADTHALNENNQWPLDLAAELDIAEEILKKEFDFIQQLSFEQTKDPKIRQIANKLHTHLTNMWGKLTKYSSSKTTKNDQFKKLVTRLLALISSKLWFSTPNTAFSLLKGPFALNDDSVVDTQSLADPAKALPVITPIDKPYTQTEAYLSIPSLREAVIRAFPEALKQYPLLIRRIITQEKKFPDYSVFYHGQARGLIPLYDVITGIQQWFIKQENIPDFMYLRLPQDQKNVTIKNLLDIMIKGFGDYFETVAKHLLSVNLSLFGNTFNIPAHESTFDFFTVGKSVRFPQDQLYYALEHIFNKLKLSKAYIPKIIEVAKLLESPTGALLQIFIPTNEVNNYTYLSAPHAFPLNLPEELPEGQKYYTLVPVTVVDKSGEKVTYDLSKLDTKTYLELYKNHPEAFFSKDLDGIQARINITPDFLLSPKSGVKIFRYTTVPLEKFNEYKQKLKDIITSMMIEWENTNTQAEKYAVK